MTLISILVTNLVVVAAAFLVVWLLCLRLKDPTPIDAYWGLGMGVLATSTLLQLAEPSARSWLLVVLCWAWAIRLASYMIWRWHNHGPDRRYTRMIEKSREKRGWGFALSSMMLVIVPQAPLQFIVGLPIQLGQVAEEPAGLGVLALAGAAVAVFGLAWETIADVQLIRFRKNPENALKIMKTGLWRYSRHPNYFGEATFWWGLFLIAAETVPGRYSVIGPIILTWVLFSWSGLPTMEHRMRKQKLGYADYIESTSSFIPMPPAKKKMDS
ncbi:MAG: DUF1295 domain-containing protein [Steroidobacteraceae bacterium]